MKFITGVAVTLLLLSSCARKDSVLVSGRVENGDSIVSIGTGDSIYTFLLDENGFFSGTVPLKKSIYASFLPSSLDLYLSPGEDLEIYLNTQNISGSLNFSGSLGGINNYLKEQEMAIFFDRDFYTLSEKDFVQKMLELIEEKTTLLEAKNFDPDFTNLEKQRIRYSVGEHILIYPLYKQRNQDEFYVPGKDFSMFLHSFSLDRDELFVTRDYRKFLLNYVYFQGGNNYHSGEGYSGGIADYILTHFEKPYVRDFLLSEAIYRYMLENNGLDGAEHLLQVFRKECKDSKRIQYIEDLIARWEKLLAGQPAPAFEVKGEDGRPIRLEDFRGSYLYIGLWASWCVPCKKELPYIELLEKEYKGKNIKFLCISIDPPDRKNEWKRMLKKGEYGGIQAIAGKKGRLGQDYMIISIPRFMLIGPDGRIVSCNAPRPSGPILSFLNKQNL